MKYFFLTPLVIGVLLGSYAGVQVARVDRHRYQLSSEYGDELLVSRLERLDSAITQLEGESQNPTEGKTFQSKLLQFDATSGGTNGKLPSELLKKRRLERKALQEKLDARKRQKIKAQETAKARQIQERTPIGILQSLLEKKEEVSTLQQEQSFWQQHSSEKLPDAFDVTVVAGELSDSQKAQIALAYKLFPSDFPSRVKLKVTYADANMRNGMAGKGIIILKGQNEDLFFHTLVHEAGHAYGLRAEHAGSPGSGFYDLQIPIASDDPSVPYYQMSWADNTTQLNTAFPSRYGQTDPFEDFAESYIYYILQGKAFREEAQVDPVIAQKYAYMKQVFAGKEYNSFADFSKMPFSIQEIPFDPEKYFEANR